MLASPTTCWRVQQCWQVLLDAGIILNGLRGIARSGGGARRALAPCRQRSETTPWVARHIVGHRRENGAAPVSQAPLPPASFMAGKRGPAEEVISAPGDNPVTTSVTCVVTRFRLKRPWYLIATYLDYRRVLADARGTPGLLRSAFLIENLHTCFSLSIWESPANIPRFGTNVPSHIPAARRLFGRSKLGGLGAAEVWSTKWNLRTVSNNLQWDGFDLRAHLLRSL